MSDVLFYADVHLPFAVVAGLKRAGFDVLTSHEAEMTTASDAAQLKFAHSSNRVMLTQDKDFLRLHASGCAHAGTIYLRQRRGGIGEMVAAVIELADLGATELAGQLFFR